MGEIVLDVQNVTKQHKNHRGIFHINLTLHKGDVFGLMGPNGAGKSTLFKILVGLIKADQGKIRFFGHSLDTAFEQAMKKVGCLIEKSVAYEHLSALQNLQLAARFYADIHPKDIEEALKTVGLYEVRKEKVSDFSAGMKQRIALANALISNPVFVILDEPITNLDLDGMIEVRNIIHHLSTEKGITFLISSHSANEMEKICNRVGVLFKGELLKIGDIDELTERQSLEEFYLNCVQTNGVKDHE
ncbi:ABC-2 type transport system ATP-binding protein [Seinonella peptonophila]|uniref:ABC-2 type transport system ATP-binding protein n=1 Tax=Seinonella peptonophila TaxID=112248 RepID=A0A1M4ZN58_9BACL|nr:ABC transporter ATP-binding protein [Seinonella peptonophila]SHF19232.1 ABC-2 type transport system ATP-binding protein [Seinonella peptonophila]